MLNLTSKYVHIAYKVLTANTSKELNSRKIRYAHLLKTIYTKGVHKATVFCYSYVKV